uniref:Protein kinase domain-containing protein n=1 Tax=Caenorhabditis tropicalis TaxID=1561998 RepID=A0A1I7T3C6_9PELO
MNSDSRREGFYIRYTAVNSSCQKHFPGYFTSSILPDERSLTIPAAFNGHALVIDHSCSYNLQIRAKPYPPGEEKYIIEKRHTVPDCIDKYCSCRPGDVAAIRDVSVDSEYRLNWKFDKVHGKEYQFYNFDSTHKKKGLEPEKEEFTFRIANSESYEISATTSEISPGTFQYQIPFQFTPFQQYKISIFAVDDSFCHNEDVFYIFNSTESNPTSSTISEEGHKTFPELSGSPITKPNLMMESYALVIFLVVVACMSPICTVLVLILLRRRRKEKKKRHHFLHRRSLSCSRHSIIETNILYRPPNEVNGGTTGEWLIRGQDIVVGTVIGEGAFGQVFKGILRGPNRQVVPVAVKQLKANAIDEEREEFVREIQMMQTVGQHDNIVTMYGYCMDEQLQCMIMEYVPYGDLKHYLQNMRKEKDSDSSIDANEFLSFAGQVACGMAHLESVGIIHRDLAARNILVGTGKVLKISDFGMSRPGVYIKMSKGVIPLRWLSPEAIKDNTYSNKSDVWAFGVLLWEIATLGGFPYNNVPDKDILNKLTEGMRLEQPTKCSDEMYILMKSCWNLKSEDRPTFLSILSKLEQITSTDSDAPPSDPPAKN